MISALCITPFVRSRLRQVLPVHLLHIFERACNLINTQGEIISLVTDISGRGPFAIVVPMFPSLFRQINVDTPVAIVKDRLMIGGWEVNTAAATLWSPQPSWAGVPRRENALFHTLSLCQRLLAGAENGFVAVAGRRAANAKAKLLQGIATEDVDSGCAGAYELAGLGRGLTPAGDDFLMGVIYALWATRSATAARTWAEAIVETAAPRTTSLSQAWLQAAARGEAGDPWHELVSAIGRPLVNKQGDDAVVKALRRILDTGHTSGVDALVGFTAVLKQRPVI